MHSSRLQSLLAYLMVHCREPQPRHQVAFALWPDSSDAQAQTSLRQALHRLRRAWPTSARLLHATPTTLHWPDSTGLTIDVRQFLDGVEQAETPDGLAAALAWYRGPLLPACDDEWLVAERERLQQHWLSGLIHLSEQREAAQQYDEAIAAAEEIRQYAPLDERHYQRLMRLHMQAGNQSAALHIYQACVEMLAREFGASPSADTQALHSALRNPTPAPHPMVAMTGFPAQPTSFVGRAAELHTLHQLLDQPDCRLLTVLGAGGVGKTRLAIAAAEQRCMSYLHGAVFVPLAQASTTDDVLLALITAFDISLAGQGELWERVVVYVQPRTLLLVLDACEHVLPDAATLLSDLLTAAPGLTLLVTSRVALRVQWEQRLPLDGLQKTRPKAASDTNHFSDAVTLFFNRVRRIQPWLAPTSADLAAIDSICQTVDGLPLGIEIAAALIDQMDCATIAHTMQQQRLTSETTLRDVPLKQRSLYATTASSWQRLTPDEQRSYRCLAPFRGSFTIAAVQTVAAATPEHLQRFVDTSLLRQIAPNRYQFHDVLHEFATLQLTDPVEREAVYAAHSAYHLNLLQQQQAHLHGSSPRHGLDTIQEHYSDIRAAWQWAVEHQQWAALLNSVQPLGDFYAFRAWIQVGYEHFRHTIQAIHSAMQVCTTQVKILWSVAAQVAYRVAWFDAYRGDLIAAQEMAACGVQYAETAQADWEEALTRYYLGHILVWRGQLAAAQPHLVAAQAGFEAHNDSWYLQEIAETYGEIALLECDYTQAQHHYRRALAYAETLGANIVKGTHLLLLGRALFMDGTIEAAHDAFTSGLKLAREHEDHLVASSCLVGIGWVALVQGRGEDAWQSFRNSIALACSISVPLVMLHATIGIAQLLGSRGDIIRATELLRLVIAHPACDEEPRMRAHALLDELVATLPPEQQDVQRHMLPEHTLDEALASVLATSPDAALSS